VGFPRICQNPLTFPLLKAKKCQNFKEKYRLFHIPQNSSKFTTKFLKDSPNFPSHIKSNNFPNQQFFIQIVPFVVCVTVIHRNGKIVQSNAGKSGGLLVLVHCNFPFSFSFGLGDQNWMKS
jgi:hypothetical protein